MPTNIPTFRSEFIDSKVIYEEENRKETVKIKNFPMISKQVKNLKSSHTSFIDNPK